MIRSYAPTPGPCTGPALLFPPDALVGTSVRAALAQTMRTVVCMETAWGTVAFDNPVPSGKLTCEVLVVGLGGSGLAAVNRAVDLGFDTIGVDRRYPAAGAAGANGGFLLAGLADFYHTSRQRWGADLARQLYADTVEQAAWMYSNYPGVCRNTGSLRVGDDPDDLAAHAAALTADRFPVKHYQGPEGTGIRIGTDGVFDPIAVARMDTDRAVHGGARLYTGCAVEQLSTGRAVTAYGTIDASVATIIAVDGGVELFTRRPGLRTVRLHMLATGPLDHAVTAHAVYRRGGLDYFQQLPDGRLLVGGGRDLDRGQQVCALSATGLSPEVNRWLDQLVAELAPSATVTHRWSAPVGYSDDGSIVIDEIDDGVWLLGGYSGTGNLTGRLVARACVDRLVGDTKRFDRWRKITVAC